MVLHPTIFLNQSGLTTAPADPKRTGAGSGYAARAQARFARNGAIMRRSLASPAAAAAPFAPSCPYGVLWGAGGDAPFGDDVAKPNR